MSGPFRSPVVASLGPVEDSLEAIGIDLETIASIGIFIAVAIVAYLVGRAIVGPLFTRVANAQELDPHARRPLKKLLNFLIFFAALSVAFGAAGFGNFLRSLATIAAAATLAIGFALQDVIKNFVAGIFIFTDRPFRIGDWIEWDGNSGIVEDISLRVSRVRTFDNELLTVPNSHLTDTVVKNPVANGRLRLKVDFGIGYDDDIEKATEIIVEEAEKHEGIMEEPAPSVRLVELGDSSVGLQSRIWIESPTRADFVKTRGEYVQTVKERFDAEGINIPYPNRTIGGDLQIQGIDDLATQSD